MENIFNKKLIAFQTVDREGDIWCNRALLFENEEEVNLFFTNPQKVIETLELELDEDAGETIDSFISIFSDGVGNRISAVIINLEYCGEMWIKRMMEGFIIRNN